jgi:hypothetical protein
MQLRRFAWSCAVPALVLSAWMACAQSVPAVTGNERVDKLLSQMTLEEKLKLIHGTQEDPVLSLTKIPSGGKMDPGPEFIARFSDCFRLSRSCPVTAEHNENRTKRIAPGGGRTSPGGFPHLVEHWKARRCKCAI